jgi:predicted HAD superfamily Cof-like phosphohydrolase
MQTLLVRKTNFQKVQEFNRAFDMVQKEPANYISVEIKLGRAQVDAFIHIRPELFRDSLKIIKLRLDLIDEEIEELNHAIETNDFVETRDALADILYVVYGMADVLGINIDTLFIENIDNKYINNKEMYNEARNQMFSGISKYANQDETNGKPIGLTNFDWIRLVCDNIPYSLCNIPEEEYYKNTKEDNLKIIQRCIGGNYKTLEQYCISNKEKTFTIIAEYIYQLLKYVYTYSYIAGIDADADFAIVHSSNMSKLCDSERDAITTVADYIEKYVAGKSPYDSPYYYELPELGKWIVKNKSTGKALKNIKYQKVDFSSK